ncbi:AlpA family phage regulatory protein [Mariprofundus ferrooxydans]|nr:AlpA family phage regulatory protein [Mariprofundus ferrooxydans]
MNKIIPSIGFMRLPAVLAVYPVSKTTWWAGVKSGRYPQSIKLGPKTTAWRVSDIVRLIDKMSGGDDSMMQ